MRNPADQRSTSGTQEPELEDWQLLPVGIMVTDEHDLVVRANPAAGELMGRGSEDLEGRNLADLVDPVDAAPLRECVLEARDTGEAQSIRLPSVSRSAELLITATPKASGEVLVAVQNASAIAAGDDLSLAMQAVLDDFEGFVGIADDRANVTFVNEAARRILGIDTGDLGALRLTDMLHADTFNLYYGEIRPALLDKGWWSGVLQVATQGAPREMWATVLAGRGDQPDTIDWLAAVTGNHEESATAVELAHRANHDHLTGLANRARFIDRLRLALMRRDRANHPVTVAFLDLDGFKAVNDDLGHHVGDELLSMVAQRLTSLMRPTDTVARWGGDEFVMLCEDAGDPDEFAARLASGLSDSPFELAGRSHCLGATIGTASSPPGPSGAEELVAAADAAMYCAKRARRPPGGVGS